MSSKLANSIEKVLSDDADVRAATRSHQTEFPYDRDKETQVTRREFCNFLGLTSTALFIGAAGYAAKSEFETANAVVPAPMQIDGAETLARNAALNFNYPTATDPAILIRLSDGTYHAYGQKCTHLSCPVFYSPESERIECPCHEAGFESKTGRVLYGPPPRPLDRVKLETRNGRVWAVGKTKGGDHDESA